MGVVPACKDRGITFRHLANMTSGYLQPERPGLPRDITMTLGWSINTVMIPSLGIVQVCAGNAHWGHPYLAPKAADGFNCTMIRLLAESVAGPNRGTTPKETPAGETGGTQ